MVQTEDLVVDHSLHHIEEAEADQQRANQKPGRPIKMPPVGGTPEHGQADHHEDLGADVEEAVEKRVKLEVFDTVCREAGTGHHVMPLQDLMQDDAVEEAAEAKAEEDAGGDREPPLGISRVMFNHGQTTRIEAPSSSGGGDIAKEPAGLLAVGRLPMMRDPDAAAESDQTQ